MFRFYVYVYCDITVERSRCHRLRAWVQLGQIHPLTCIAWEELEYPEETLHRTPFCEATMKTTLSLYQCCSVFQPPQILDLPTVTLPSEKLSNNSSFPTN